MKEYALSTAFLLVFFSFTAIAQEIPEDSVPNTLDHQITEVFEKSNNYQNYKVIEKVKLNTLKKNILDSVSGLQSTILGQQSDISKRKKTIDSLNISLTKVKEELKESQERENGIEFLGMLTSKTTYNSIVWILILILLIVGGFFFYRYSTSHSIIRDDRQKIEELEAENEEMRRSHLEREQKLRRKLQDEINKNRNI